MQKIINGKKYDTKTAMACGTYVEPILFTNCETFITLYRKTNGEYFLHEYWREMIFIVEVRRDVRIEPLTEEKAKKWAERHLSVRVYEEIFGAVPE